MFREEELKALGIFHLKMCGYDTCHRVSQEGQWQRNKQTVLCMHGWDWGTWERMSLESFRFGIWLRVEVWSLK